MGHRESFSCLICNGHDPGLDILGKHICSRCEKLLLQLPVDNAAYEYYKERIKLIWTEAAVASQQ